MRTPDKPEKKQTARAASDGNSAPENTPPISGHVSRAMAEFNETHPRIKTTMDNEYALIIAPQDKKIQDTAGGGQNIKEALDKLLTTPEFTKKLHKTKVQILDLTHAQFINSAFCSTLVSLKKKLDEEGIRLVMAGIQPQFMETLKMTNLIDFFGAENIYATLNDATTALRREKRIRDHSRGSGPRIG